MIRIAARDRDFLTEDYVNAYNQHSSGKIYVLKKHEIENYLLDEHIISKVQEEIFGLHVTPDVVKNKLKSIAVKLSGEVLRDMISYRMNLIYRLNEDFPLGKFLNDQVIINSTGELDTDKLDLLRQKFNDKIKG